MANVMFDALNNTIGNLQVDQVSLTLKYPYILQ